MLAAESDALQSGVDIRDFVAALVEIDQDHRYRIDGWGGRPG